MIWLTREINNDTHTRLESKALFANAYARMLQYLQIALRYVSWLVKGLDKARKRSHWQIAQRKLQIVLSFLMRATTS